MANPGTAGDADRIPGDFSDLGDVQETWRQGLLILMYHAIEPPPIRHRLRYLFVDPRKLRSQLRELLSEGVSFIRASDLHAISATERKVLVTLDDGFQSVFLNALPVFKELGVPAITYIVAGQLGGSNIWDQAKGLPKRFLMSRAEILEWVQAGYEIGAHTMTHPNLTAISPDQARREIFDSKKILEDLIGQPIRHFCYPYGKWNALLRELVIEAGYETACTIDRGYNLPDTDKFSLHRLIARHRHPKRAAYLCALRSLLP